MKTVLVVFSDKPLKKSELYGVKKYSFNTQDDVKVGDMIESKSYKTPLLVVKVLDKEFKYYNSATGELSNEFSSSNQWEVKTLKIVEGDEDSVVYGSFLNKTSKSN